MEPGQNQLDPWELFFFMQVNRHTATIVSHRHGSIFTQNDSDFAGVTFQRLINAVVDDFLRQMIGPGGVRVHARALLDGVKAFQDLNRVCAIILSDHSVLLTSIGGIRIQLLSVLGALTYRFSAARPDLNPRAPGLKKLSATPIAGAG